MKFCTKCGEEIYDEAVICPKCGCETGYKLKNQTLTDESQNQDQTKMGILIGLFFGIFGIFIGSHLYQPNTVARKTFINGWKKTFIVSLIITIILIIALTIGLSIYLQRILEFLES